ncbi:MAG: S8 family serine peptidase [candidate division Zixibacteria bacterium]|nr:S8 family serine peptidase [candidate division Zixibacteria bacterium]
MEDFLNSISSSPVQLYWIAPCYTATIPASSLGKLSTMSAVTLIIPNLGIDFIPVVESSPAPQSVSTIASELNAMGVPQLWQRGLTGKGRLVCSFDTGVEGAHPALSSKWRGRHSTLSSSWFSSVSPDSLPSDKVGHGTHTMGIMVGSASADSFGVAPGAEWISAAVIDQGRPLGTTVSDIIAAFQWSLNPDGNISTTNDVPDVILNSWGIPTGLFGPCDQTFWSVIDNVEAAGIVTIFAAGNEGPNQKTIRNPADRGSSPTNSFSVGAIDLGNVVANFSSRGPSACDPTHIKPELVAPGVVVRSSTKGGGFAFMSGTSMAAPYIAGLVALCRQYNPDATVDEIKQALINAANDLGPVGEDNAYGYGLVDASRLPDFLSAPSRAEFSVAGQIVNGDGVASPGELIGLTLYLTQNFSLNASVQGRLKPRTAGNVAVINQQSGFIFGEGGVTAMNAIPFTLMINESVPNGASESLVLYVETTDGSVIDSVELILTVGFIPPGPNVSHAGTAVRFSVSGFGQYGLAYGSIYNLNGEGFCFGNSENLLYESGLIVGRSALQLSSAIRNSQGSFTPSDFAPIGEFSQSQTVGELRYTVGFDDRRSSIPLPITISQETISYSSFEDNSIVIMNYTLTNKTLERLTNLRFGFLNDFDLPGANKAYLDEVEGFIYQHGEGGAFIGLVALKNVNSFTSISNVTGKTGFTKTQQFSLISTNVNNVDSSLSGDLLFIAASNSITLEPRGNTEVAFALIAGDNLGQLYENMARARAKYDIATGIEDDPDVLPQSFSLEQNYPNPFNPSTTISFGLSERSHVSIRVFNIQGQTVKTLTSGELGPGSHSVLWDATNDRNEPVSTGIYFYRLDTNFGVETRKMVLLR